jgi:hypothetical protein
MFRNTFPKLFQKPWLNNALDRWAKAAKVGLDLLTLDYLVWHGPGPALQHAGCLRQL